MQNGLKREMGWTLSIKKGRAAIRPACCYQSFLEGRYFRWCRHPKVVEQASRKDARASQEAAFMPPSASVCKV